MGYGRIGVRLVSWAKQAGLKRDNLPLLVACTIIMSGE